MFVYTANLLRALIGKTLYSVFVYSVFKQKVKLICSTCTHAMRNSMQVLIIDRVNIQKSIIPKQTIVVQFMVNVKPHITIMRMIQDVHKSEENITELS